MFLLLNRNILLSLIFELYNLYSYVYQLFVEISNENIENNIEIILSIRLHIIPLQRN